MNPICVKGLPFCLDFNLGREFGVAASHVYKVIVDCEKAVTPRLVSPESKMLALVVLEETSGTLVLDLL